MPLRLKVREVVKLLEERGWVMAGQRGSHQQFEHPAIRGKVTVSGAPHVELKPGTLGSILRQAGIDPKELRT